VLRVIAHDLVRNKAAYAEVQRTALYCCHGHHIGIVISWAAASTGFLVLETLKALANIASDMRAKL